MQIRKTFGKENNFAFNSKSLYCMYIIHWNRWIPITLKQM